MLIHLARIAVITIALALVGGVGMLLARPQPPTVITVIVPQQAAAPSTTTVVQPAYIHPAYYPYSWPYWSWGTRAVYVGD
jgi:hypothetical protein